MTQPFSKWSEDKRDRVKRMSQYDQDRYAEEAIEELNARGCGRMFGKNIENDFDMFSPENQRKYLKAVKAKRQKRMKRKEENGGRR